MTAIQLFPLISFVLISTFTPGPSNISTASLGVLHGYKNTLAYQVGLAVGVFVMMLISGWISSLLLHTLPALEPILRYVGAAYILYLAWAILKAGYTFTADNIKPMGFGHGLMLQLLNPKLMVYALTLFSTFLTPITGNVVWVIVAVTLLSATAFCATSTWALFGTAIKNYLHNPRLKAIINIILSLFLVYTALVLAGLI
ncbi:MAG: LysE family translocator [Anaerolineae bacterium]|nr:LysE family translocator [Anaerolineae bacterium]